MKTNKFTLIELLVVVAIIGILASLLLPSLGKARKKGQVAVCTSNLRQINTAAFLYQDDSEGYYPAGSYANGVSWDDMLSSYDGRNLTDAQMKAGGIYGPSASDLPGGEESSPLYRCPLDDRSAVQNRVLRTYSHTQAWYGQQWDNVYDKGAGIIGARWDIFLPFSRSITDISNPSETIAFTELADEDQTASNDNNHLRSSLGVSWTWTGIRADKQEIAVLSHHPNNKYNYAMTDGSVKSMTILQSLVKGDGSIATSSNVFGSKWDATK
ncbi:type II secretion system protein [Lentisphaera profundi]|uniref:Type II secretion system protein n=1 Tax=Lentisphaera profundi TaxID=1658616 RepID=A0ABY7W1T9_9BACT|nr:type II secretion system protein [Lentisphaera profundi]WDE99443.1 type II secretion system protein [Lentisphaera profundi]